MILDLKQVFENENLIHYKISQKLSRISSYSKSFKFQMNTSECELIETSRIKQYNLSENRWKLKPYFAFRELLQRYTEVLNNTCIHVLDLSNINRLHKTKAFAFMVNTL